MFSNSVWAVPPAWCAWHCRDLPKRNITRDAHTAWALHLSFSFWHYPFTPWFSLAHFPPGPLFCLPFTRSFPHSIILSLCYSYVHMDTCEYTVMHSLPSLQIHEIKKKKKGRVGGTRRFGKWDGGVSEGWGSMHYGGSRRVEGAAWDEGAAGPSGLKWAREWRTTGSALTCKARVYFISTSCHDGQPATSSAFLLTCLWMKHACLSILLSRRSRVQHTFV